MCAIKLQQVDEVLSLVKAMGGKLDKEVEISVQAFLTKFAQSNAYPHGTLFYPLLISL